MKRWNGWGDMAIDYPLEEPALDYLEKRVGVGLRLIDSSLSQAIARVPQSQIPEHPAIFVEPEARVRHARGQSLPDWIALRAGKPGVVPDGVWYPASPEEVRTAIEFASNYGISLIPYGGGTSVVGHINPLTSPTLTLDLSHMNLLLELDENSRQATFQAGVSGPDLERQLRQHGYTLGHFPQSFEYSTLGGWIATRSSGQQSMYYGRIEDLFAGGHLETPSGSLDLPAFPASAAGPDLRQVLLGSEGHMGVLTQATVRVRPLPEAEGFYAVFFKDFASGVEAVRRAAQNDFQLSMLRLSDATETETTFRLAGRDQLIAWANRGLRLLNYGNERCLLILGVSGGRIETGKRRDQAIAHFRAHGGLGVGSLIGETWRKSRFLTPYLRNTLWERGYATDTLETAVPWRNSVPAWQAIKAALQTEIENLGEKALIFAHLSHLYQDGASIYLTYIFRRAASPEETLERWEKLKMAASNAIVDQQGTISHHHGIGIDHLPYLSFEKGLIGISALQSFYRQFDPQGIMNPGKLI